MQPNNPFEPASQSIDYLNQIATPTPPQGMNKRTKLILVIGGVIAVLSLFLIAMSSMNKDVSSETAIKLAGKLSMLESLATKYNPKLKSSDIQEANTSFKSLLVTSTRSYNDALRSYEINVKKQGRTIKSLAKNKELDDKLEDAHLNSRLDRVYAKEMTFQIQEVLLMMKQLQRTVRTKEMKEFIDKTTADLNNIKSIFEKGPAY